MSGIKLREARRVPDRDSVCVLQCAHPPGQPLRLWLYDGVLPSLQEEKAADALRSVWALLHDLDPEGRNRR